MRSLKFFAILLGALFVTGVGVGLIAGWLGDDGNGPVWLLVCGLAAVIFGLGGFIFGLRMKPAEEDGDSQALELFLGDMSDPVQRNIILRVAIAAAIHGILLIEFLGGGFAPVDLAAGELGRADYMTLAAYGVFAATLVWIAVECVIFHNIDEFWTRIVLGPTALSGVILLFAVVLWTLAEEVLGAPEARFWAYYALYYVSTLVLLVGKSQLDRRAGGGVRG